MKKSKSVQVVRLKKCKKENCGDIKIYGPDSDLVKQKNEEILKTLINKKEIMRLSVKSLIYYNPCNFHAS
jgi:hypothetical protein